MSDFTLDPDDLQVLRTASRTYSAAAKVVLEELESDHNALFAREILLDRWAENFWRYQTAAAFAKDQERNARAVAEAMRDAFMPREDEP